MPCFVCGKKQKSWAGDEDESDDEEENEPEEEKEDAEQDIDFHWFP